MDSWIKLFLCVYPLCLLVSLSVASLPYSENIWYSVKVVSQSEPTHSALLVVWQSSIAICLWQDQVVWQMPSNRDVLIGFSLWFSNFEKNKTCLQFLKCYILPKLSSEICFWIDLLHLNSVLWVSSTPHLQTLDFNCKMFVVRCFMQNQACGQLGFDSSNGMESKESCQTTATPQSTAPRSICLLKQSAFPQMWINCFYPTSHARPRRAREQVTDSLHMLEHLLSAFLLVRRTVLSLAHSSNWNQLFISNGHIWAVDWSRLEL